MDKTKGDIGDYDVLAFSPPENILLVIEAKHLVETRCLKDAKRQRDRIYGNSSMPTGYLGKIEVRHAFLDQHWAEAIKIMGWPKPSTKPRIVSFYVAQKSYWWTKFPIRSTPVLFTRLELLEGELRKLILLK